jgi:nicotinamidase-related amidase
MAVWDDFLTERDHEHLALGWRKAAPFGLGDRPSLLVIDDVQGVVGDEPLPLLEAIAHGPAVCGLEGWEAITKTKELLHAARLNGVLVVYTTNGGAAAGTSLFHTASHMWPPPGEVIHRDIPPQPGDLIVRKGAASAFFGTTLIAHLVAAGVDTVVVCGNSTSGCVRHTVLDASAYQFKVAVVEDCTFDRTQASHAMNLFDMNQKYADVIDSTEAIKYFASVAGA